MRTGKRAHEDRESIGEEFAEHHGHLDRHSPDHAVKSHAYGKDCHGKK